MRCASVALLTAALLLSSGCLVLSLQPAYDDDSLAYFSTDITAPGVIHHTYGNRLSLGEPNGTRSDRIRAKLSRAMFADNVQKPTTEELEEARHHAEHTHELEAGLDHPAAGHEFDDHNLRDAEDVPLRQH